MVFDWVKENGGQVHSYLVKRTESFMRIERVIDLYVNCLIALLTSVTLTEAREDVAAFKQVNVRPSYGTEALSLRRPSFYASRCELLSLAQLTTTTRVHGRLRYTSWRATSSALASPSSKEF